MITAVDTNILLDIAQSKSDVAIVTARTVAAMLRDGPLLICPVVFAELAVSFASEASLLGFLSDLHVRQEGFSSQALWHTGRAWASYLRQRGQRVQCPRCGHHASLPCARCQSPISWRQHLITDFLIGGHAATAADRLLTRDRGYYRTYFPQLPLVTPEVSNGATS